jgi:hypothetical protein
MQIITLIMLMSFDAILTLTEAPKMLKSKSYKDFAAFSALLLIGTAMAVMKILNINIPNISGVLAWVYSPLKNVIKWLTEG